MYPPNQGGGQGPFGPQQGGPFGAPSTGATGSAFGAVPTNPSPDGGAPFRTAPGQYEFSQSENGVFSSLALFTKIAAVVLVISLCVSAVQALLTVSRKPEHAAMAIGPVIGSIVLGALLNGFFAYWMWRSSAAFARVVETQGNDIPNLMDALASQRSYFKAMKVLVLVGVGFGVLACVGAIVMGGLFASMH
jgi:hypothetical protein